MWILFISSAWRPCCKITCMCSRLEACFQNCTGILLHICALPILQSVTGWNPAQGGRFLLACTTLIMWVLLHNCVHSCPLQRSLLLQVVRIRCQSSGKAQRPMCILSDLVTTKWLLLCCGRGCLRVSWRYISVSVCAWTKYTMWCQEKKDGALDSCFRLVGPHQQSIPQLLSLAP